MLLKAEHEKLWDITTEIYRTQVPEETFKHKEERFKSFRAGYGTVGPPGVDPYDIMSTK